MSRLASKVIGFIFIIWTFPAFSQVTWELDELVDEELAQDAATQAMDMATMRNEIIYRSSLGRADDVAILLKQGASVNEVNDTGTTIVSLAASRLDAEGMNVLKILVDAGADLGKADANGQNALFYAAKFGNNQAVEYILSKKDIAYSTVDNLGNTARSVAYDAGHKDIVELLDNFVRGKNEEIKKQYADEIRKQYNATYQRLDERYKAYKQAAIVEKNNAGVNAKASAISAVSDLRKIVHDMSFASCSAAYWQYFNSSRKPTELKSNELTRAVSANRQKKGALATSLVNVSKMDGNLVHKINNISEVQIVYQLAIQYHNVPQNEQKIGAMSDVNARCATIADGWTDVDDTK